MDDRRRKAPSGAKWLVIGIVAVLLMGSLALLITVGGTIIPQLLPPSECLQKYRQAEKLIRENPRAAKAMMMEAVKLSRDAGVSVQDKAWIQCGFLNFMYREKKYYEMLDYTQETLQSCREAGLVDQEANILTIQADALRRTNRPSDAVKAIQAALATKEKLYGKDSKEAATSLYWLGPCYLAAGKIDDAERAYNQLLVTADKIGADAMDKKEGGWDFRTLKPQAKLGLAYVAAYRKNVDESQKKFRECVAWYDKVYDPGASSTEQVLRDYVTVLEKAGFHAEAQYYNAKLDDPIELDSAAVHTN